MLSNTRPTERPPLSEALNQSQVDMLYYKYAAVFHLLKKAGVPSSLFAGSLLGAVRNKGIIPWDDDGDMAIRANHVGEFAKMAEKLPPCFYLIRHVWYNGEFFYKVCHYDWYVEGNNPGHVDLDAFIYYDEPGNKCTTKIDWMGRFSWPGGWHKDLIEVEMGPYRFPAIRGWECAMKETYGEDCMQNAQKFNHSSYAHKRGEQKNVDTVRGLVPSTIVRIPDMQKKEEKPNRSYWDSVYLAKQVTDRPSTFAQWVKDTLAEKNLVQWSQQTKLVDLGCGNGRDTMFFSTCSTAVGIDQSIDTCQVGPQLSFVKKDASEVRDEFAQADVLYLRFFVHAVPRPVWARIFKNLGDMCKVGSVLCIEARTWADPMAMCGKRLSRYENVTDHYRRYQDIEELTRQLGLIGFERVVGLHGFGLSVYNGEDPHLLRLVLRRREKKSFDLVGEVEAQFSLILQQIEGQRRVDHFDRVEPAEPAKRRGVLSRFPGLLILGLVLVIVVAMKK